MTFMRKFINLLNMDNWTSNINIDEQNNSIFQENVTNSFPNELTDESQSPEAKTKTSANSISPLQQNTVSYQYDKAELIKKVEPLITNAKQLADTINTTTDELTFYISYTKLLSILNQLTLYDKYDIFLHSTASTDLENALANINTAINELYLRIAETKKKAQSASNTSPFMMNVRKYWKEHPQPYERNIPEASPSEYDHYAKVLFLYWYGNLSSPCDMEHCSPSNLNECHISNPSKLYLSLVFNDYLTQSSVFNILSSYKVSELKILADSIGCKKNGNKKELVTRIYNNLSDEDKSDILSSHEYYSATEKGVHFLQENYDYVELHKHQKYHVSLAEFNSERVPFNKKRLFNDTIYTVVSKRIYTEFTHNLFRYMAHDYFTLYEICFSEGRSDIAIKDYITFLYLKSCCIHELDSYNNDYNYIPAPDSYHVARIVIFTLKDAYRLTKLADYYSDHLIDSVYAMHYPPNLLTHDEFLSAMHDMLSQTTFDFDKYNKIIGQRIYEFAQIDHNLV